MPLKKTEIRKLKLLDNPFVTDDFIIKIREIPSNYKKDSTLTDLINKHKDTNY